MVRSVSHCVRLVTADHGHTARSLQGQHSNVAYERLQLLLQFRAARPDAACHYPLEQDAYIRRPKAGSTTKPPALGPRELAGTPSAAPTPAAPRTASTAT